MFFSMELTSMQVSSLSSCNFLCILSGMVLLVILELDRMEVLWHFCPRFTATRSPAAEDTGMASRGGGGAAAATLSGADMEKMSVEQLKAIKEQSDLEVNLLQDSLNKIRTATTRLEIASTALHDLSLRPQGKKMLVPLTASLYVPGMLDDAEKVLVDVGTGYFIEKTMAEGKDYCSRKINLLKSNYDELLEVASKRKAVADEAGAILQAKLRQASTPT